MRLIFVSGLSGAGKSVALHLLEDLGYYCIDNLPAALLKDFIGHTVRSNERAYGRTAVGIDARNAAQDIASLPALIDELKRSGIRCEVLFLQANDEELLRRFSETKRRHPMVGEQIGLREAIETERKLLEPMAYAADLVLDTSRMGVHDLRDVIVKRVEQRAIGRLSITFESFGFKNGLPGDADFVFDARTLPNPYWEPGLRAHTGRDPDVMRWLQSHDSVRRLLVEIGDFVALRITDHAAANRGYLTIAVGCTGGQHRSVYLVDRLCERFAIEHPHVLARHSALSGDLLAKSNVTSGNFRALR